MLCYRWVMVDTAAHPVPPTNSSDGLQGRETKLLLGTRGKKRKQSKANCLNVFNCKKMHLFLNLYEYLKK